MNTRQIFENELLEIDKHHGPNKVKDDKLILGHDFRGWPISAMTLREILKKLGFKETKNGFIISSTNKLLDAYPYILTDDGMGYGVEPRFITEANTEIYETEFGGKKIPVFTLFREKYFLDLEEKNEDK